MKFLVTLSFLYYTFLAQPVCAQYFASSYRPKNRTKKLIIAKIRALPEVKEWFIKTKKSEPDMIINKPDSTSEYYWFQIGLGNLGMFRTNYHLYVNPKTYKVYYMDLFDESDSKLITLKQWRQWRSTPGFLKIHRWQAGNLIVLKN